VHDDRLERRIELGDAAEVKFDQLRRRDAPSLQRRKHGMRWRESIQVG